MRLLSALLLALLISASAAVAQQAPVKTAPQTKAKQKVKKPKSTKQVAAKKAPVAPVIVFRQTPCFGICPDYDATIYPNGRVTYVGRQHTKLTGTHELKLPAATVAMILAEARNIGFRKLQPHYTENTSDLPSTFLSIRQPDGTLKTVQVEEGAPASLQKLLHYISGELDKISSNTADR